jgi:hypothetical protein
MWVGTVPEVVPVFKSSTLLLRLWDDDLPELKVHIELIHDLIAFVPFLCKET